MNRDRMIWVDADSCPRPVRDIIVRACERTGLSSVFLANRSIPILESNFARMVVAEPDEGPVDEVLLRRAQGGDMVITRDIPLAARLLENGCIVLNDRGGRFSADTIAERLSIRNTMQDFREVGLLPEGRRTYGKKEVHAFAAALDRELIRLLKPEGEVR